MLRWKNLIAPITAFALLVGFHQAQLRADDTATPAAGKATVTVTVVDANGKAVPGATVSIFVKAAKKSKNAAATSQPSDGTAAKPKPLQTGKTGADGTFALSTIPNGDFTVRVRIKGGGTGTANVTIADDKDEAVSVTLKPKN
jgi:hypothetical protein